MTCHDIFLFLKERAPLQYQMDFDNSGFLVGDLSSDVDRVLVTLDITDDVITEAESIAAQLIVSHHPLFFHKLSGVTATDPTGAKVMRLVRSGISAICMHTNLDIAEGGVNDALMHVLGAQTDGILEISGSGLQGQPIGCGRIGMMPSEMPLPTFLQHVAERLNVSGIRYVSGGKAVHRIAVCGGSGGSMLELALAAGCDTFVTADVKYDRFLTARELGINLIDADHFCTENVVIPELAVQLKKRFPELTVKMSSLKQTVSFYTVQ